MVEIKVMRTADTTLAVDLAVAEGWGHTVEDIRRILSFAPESCFVTWRDGQAVGTITSTRYGDFAFLALLLVRPEYRNQGIGRQLMEHAVAHLQSSGVKTIELDGVIRATPLYRRLGFQDKYLSLRFKGQGSATGVEIKPYRPEMLKEILDLDKSLTGLAREQVITRLLQEFSGSAYVLGENDLSTYTIVRQRRAGALSVGPLVARKPQTALHLLRGVLARHVGKTIGIGVPEMQQEIIGFLHEQKFEDLAHSLRMFLGERRDYETHTYAIISAEKS